MWQLWGKVIAPPTGNRKCVIFKMLWIHHLTFTQFASNFIRILEKHGRCETVKGILISKILLSWQRVKPQFSFFGDFEAIRAFLGGLTWSKTLENVHTHWNPRQLGRRWGWDPGVAQRLYGAPWNISENLMCSSHILARINMKLGTHIDLIEPNNFCTACHGLRPTGSQLFYCFP